MNEGDIIKAILDCNGWTLQFYRNEALIASFEIERDRTYYFCLQSGSEKSEYDII